LVVYERVSEILVNEKVNTKKNHDSDVDFVDWLLAIDMISA